MGFSPKVSEQLLVRCERHCCLCHRPTGTKIEIHHIVPRSEGGDDSADNGIPLCFDCHAEVEAYNPKHPRGRRYTASELRTRRDQWFRVVAGWHRPRELQPIAESTQSVQDVLTRMGEAALWNPDNVARVVADIRAFAEEERAALVDGLEDALNSDSEDTRWDASRVVEFLVEWDPRRIPEDLIRKMARDAFFSVRSSAAVSYYYMAAADPNDVPLDVLRRLARYDEDWYVMTPATSALRRLAHRRPIAVDVLLEGLADSDVEARRHYAYVLGQLIREHPAAARDDVVERLTGDEDDAVREVGREWRGVLEERRRRGVGTDYGIF